MPTGVRPQAAAPRAAVVFSGPTMGTRYTVRVVMAPGDDAANERVRAAIDGELSRVDRLFSGWNPASEISRLNAHASTEPFPVSAETVAALDLGRRASELTGGAFDVTVAPLVEAWGFGPPDGAARASPAPRPSPPCARASATGSCRSTPRAGPWRRRGRTWPATSRLWPGAGPPTASPTAIVALGHPDVLVDVGGEVTARGRRPDGGRWRVAVEWPDRARERGLVIELENAAVATSGDYRKAWTDAQGRRRSHILDPRTGEPVAHGLASATVVARATAPGPTRWPPPSSSSGPTRGARSRHGSASPRASSCARPTGRTPSGPPRRSRRWCPRPAEHTVPFSGYPCRHHPP